MLRRFLIQSVLCSLMAVAAPAVHAQCPAGIVTLDLKTGTVFISPALASYFSYANAGSLTAAPVVAGCPAAAGWKMAALKVVLPPTCTQANVVVEYEGQPFGWSTHIGDSLTNDGHAGDAGTTEREAEIWVFNENLSLAAANLLVPLGIDNPLTTQHLSLTNAALKFVVKDQFVSWGQPYGFVQMPATRNLFSIPDLTVPAADQRAIYLGLNRVIHGPGARTGCGARRVLVTLQ
jgi:hypothetical protein